MTSDRHPTTGDGRGIVSTHGPPGDEPHLLGLVELHGVVAAQQDQIDALRRELEVVREASRPHSGPPARDAAGLAAEGGAAIGRRRALQVAAGLAAGVATAGVASVGAAAPAAAADGQALVIGSQANAAERPTGMAVSDRGLPYGFGVTDFGLGSFPGSAALMGHARSIAFDVGVHGYGRDIAGGVRGDALSGIGVHGVATTGVAVRAESTTGDAMQAGSRSGAGGRFTSDEAHGVDAKSVFAPAIKARGPAALRLSPYYEIPPSQFTSPQIHLESGDLAVQDVGPGTQARAWFCVDGTSKSWRVLAGPDSAGSLHLFATPRRVYDSRRGFLPAVGAKTPLAPSQVRMLDLRVNDSGVPLGATGAVLTVLLVNAAAGAGNVTVWAGNVPKPQANTMVWGGSAGRFCTTALTSLDAYSRVQVSASLRTDLVVDVVGYYR